MLKSADALAGAGYDVRVVATSNELWAIEADRDVQSRRNWPVTIIDYRKGDSGLTYWWTGVRARTLRAAVKTFGVDRTPLPVAVRAYARVHSELVRAAAADPVDLIYGGTTGALAAVAEAGRRTHTPYALDLEDFHSGETSGPDATLVDALAARVEHAVLPQAAFLTTSSGPIAEAYRDKYGVEPRIVHNTFPLPVDPPDFTRVDPQTLRVYWFSQTIGPGRGLEDAIVALGIAGVVAELALRGRSHGDYVERLERLAGARAPLLRVTHQPPAPPDAMVDLARGYDVGLVLEQMVPRNRALSIANKAFTYLVAGVPVAMTDTPGQRGLAEDVGCAAALVAPGDIDALASIFRRWADDPSLLSRAKRAAWDAAVRRWRWDHPQERGVLLDLVSAALS